MMTEKELNNILTSLKSYLTELTNTPDTPDYSTAYEFENCLMAVRAVEKLIMMFPVGKIKDGKE